MSIKSNNSVMFGSCLGIDAGKFVPSLAPLLFLENTSAVVLVKYLDLDLAGRSRASLNFFSNFLSSRGCVQQKISRKGKGTHFLKR